MKQTLIEPYLIDTNTCHTPDFEVNRKPDPGSKNLIMCFRTPAQILTAQGLQTAQPGDCIIHSTTFPQYHRSVPNATEGFRNDWLCVEPNLIPPIVETLQLPWDSLIHIGYPEILTPYIKRMQKELVIDDPLANRAILNQLEGMLLAVAREYRNERKLQDELTHAERYYFPLFTMIRAQMLENCQDHITIETLAKKVNLSQERFAVLYRKFFKNTPYAELINARLILAQRLLLNTSMEIKKLSATCGWDDIHYFSRLFKKKLGICPSQYRQDALSN